MKRILFGVFFLLAWNSILHAQAPFYQGKTITLVAGTTAGSVYDAWARLVAQHWGKHIPGNPGFIVQNMAGAGSLIAANHLYTVAKPDGLTILNSTGSVAWTARTILFTSAPIRRLRRFMMCAEPLRGRSAAPRGQARSAIICQSF